MKFQVDIAVAMLVSTATPTCENLKIMKHEKDDCSDEGKEDAEMQKVVSALKDNYCAPYGEVMLSFGCNEIGTNTTTYIDKNCKEFGEPEFKAWGYDKDSKMFYSSTNYDKKTEDNDNCRLHCPQARSDVP